jgi:putative PIN family toxin of toxin-antitoxin system
MSDELRVVYDCNTFLQALAAPEGPAGQCVQLVLDDRVLLFICPEVTQELRDVAGRPTVATKLRITPERVDAFVEAIEVAAVLLEDFARPFQYSRDPDDALYVNLALAAEAELIVSRDHDLLDLTSTATREAEEFQLRFPLLRIITPVQFMREFTDR